ncbi:lipid A biosynthesis lauroyl acyltransferase [Ciceribacter sp. L1K22]|uniref:lysophospholipid acyltransferase family protein n=1 Tax=Ciceribacter sp. L1K22 TaxID=2820275 RepID=UPI001ABE1290|nr:lipid A biosynthesis lauroyl acyltransferase [Ciceribacter sp. L1K22]MBO3759757.1 lipid A biosynthesis lauroyl acyltransferase [Ciceribacter sp. L1K22]
MADEKTPKTIDLAKRKAWVYEKEAAPGLADLFAGGERSGRFFRYWVSDNVWNALHLIGHFGLKLLPMDACSAFGAKLGVYAIPRFHKSAEKRARATIAKLRPDLSKADQDKLFVENCRTQGRLMTEFSVVNRLANHPERIEVHHLEWVTEAAKRGPVIFVGMHLGNWEIGPLVLQRAGLVPYINYTPPPGRAKAWISERVRRKNGLNFLPPGLEGIRPAVRVLKSGGIVSAFCDEGVNGKIRGPLFGRKPHLEGNLAMTIRLARMTGATICPWYNLRTDGFRFVCRALPPITLPPEQKSGERLLEDIQLLNDAIEAVIRQHLDQWFFLDNALPKG